MNLCYRCHRNAAPLPRGELVSDVVDLWDYRED